MTMLILTTAVIAAVVCRAILRDTRRAQQRREAVTFIRRFTAETLLYGSVFVEHQLNHHGRVIGLRVLPRQGGFDQGMSRWYAQERAALTVLPPSAFTKITDVTGV